MPTYEKPAIDAGAVSEALRALAHATRSIEDPTEIYAVVGALSQATASLEQCLHQLAAFHDGPRSKWADIDGSDRTGRAASYQVSWELHRAGELARLTGEAVDRAHVVESTIRYPAPEPARLGTARAPRRSAASQPGLSL